MEVRNLANQKLKENDDPIEWSFFVQPLIEKCQLLLQVPALCPMMLPTKAMRSRSLVDAALHVKQQEVWRMKGPTSLWDSIVMSVQAFQIFQRYSDSHF